MSRTEDQQQCGTEPCPGCYILPERKHRKAYTFGRCPGPSDPICAEERALAHFLGDHRLCSTAEPTPAFLDIPAETCEFAAQWFGEVTAMGVTACDAADKTYAVVSIRTGTAVVHGTHARLSTAKPHRTRVGRIGPGTGYERWAAKETTFVVCRWGHLH